MDRPLDHFASPWFLFYITWIKTILCHIVLITILLTSYSIIVNCFPISQSSISPIDAGWNFHKFDINENTSHSVFGLCKLYLFFFFLYFLFYFVVKKIGFEGATCTLKPTISLGGHKVKVGLSKHKCLAQK